MTPPRGPCSTSETIANLFMIGCAVLFVLAVALALLLVVGVLVGAL